MNRIVGRFERIALDILDLARKRRREHEAIRREVWCHSPWPLPGSWGDALRKALATLSLADLRKLEVLMYAGRGDDDIRSLSRTILKKDSLRMAGMIMEKLPLDEYLEEGLAIAKSDGIDLEMPF